MMMSHWSRVEVASWVVSLAALLLTACEQDTQIDPKVHMDRALGYQEQGELRSAVLELKNVLQHSPDNLEARLLLGRLYLHIGDGFYAEKELRRVLVPGTVTEAELAVDLARMEILKGNYKGLTRSTPDSVLLRIEQYGLRPQQEATLRALYGHAYLMDGDFEVAGRFYAAALQLNPDEKEAFLGQASLAKHRDIDECRDWIHKALDKDPGFAPAWSLLGDVERSLGNAQAAEKAYNKAIEHRYNRAHDLMGRALSRFAQADYEGAQKDADRLQYYSGHAAEANYLNGLFALQKSEYREAMSAFQQSLAEEEGFMPAIFYAGLTAALMGQFNQADYYLSDYVQANPSSTIAVKQLARVRAREGNYTGAKSLLKGVIREHPGDAEALDLIGTSSLLEGSPEEAVGYLERVALIQPESATAYMRLGVGLMAQGDTERAEEVLVLAQEHSPGERDADLLLIRRHIMAGEFNKAQRVAEAFRERHPEESLPYVLLGTISVQRGDLEAARSFFSTALEKNSGDYTAAGALAALALEQNDHNQARALLTQFLQAEPGHQGALISLADIAIMQGRNVEALQLLETARSADATAWQPRLLLSHHYRALGKLRQAQEVIEEAKVIAPRNPSILEEAGRVALIMGENTSAENSFRTLTELQPDSAQAHFLWAQSLNSVGSLDRAREELEKVVRLDPQRSDAKIVLVRLLLAENNLDSAERLLRELKQILPNNPDVDTLLGELAMKRGRPAQAVIAYRMALARAPHQDVVTRLALAQAASGDQKSATATMEGWLQVHPDHANVRYSLANLYFSLNNSELAKMHYLALIESGDGNSLVHNNLSQILLMESAFDKALEHAKYALEMEPDNAILLDNLGLVYMGLFKYTDALRLFTIALDRAPNVPGYAFHKAVALRETGKDEEALRLLQDLLNRNGDFAERKQAEQWRERLLEETSTSSGDAGQ